MPEAGQLDIDDQILIAGNVWTVTQRAHFGDVTVVRDDGGCIRVDHIGRHLDVDLATEALEDLDEQVRLAEIQWNACRKYSTFNLSAGDALAKLREVRLKRDRLAGQVRR